MQGATTEIVGRKPPCGKIQYAARCRRTSSTVRGRIRRTIRTGRMETCRAKIGHKCKQAIEVEGAPPPGIHPLPMPAAIGVEAATHLPGVFVGKLPGKLRFRPCDRLALAAVHYDAPRAFQRMSDVRTAVCNALPSHRPPVQDEGTTTSGTCISSRLTPP